MTPPLAYVLAVLAMELTPGPNMAYLAVVALQAGWRGGLVAVAGVTLGLLAYLLAAVVGLAEIAARSPWIFEILRWGGVAYLLWLAWDAWAGRPAPSGLVDGPGLRRLFVRGLMANLLNPKAALLYVVLLPTFISRTADPAVQALHLGLIHIAVSVAVHLAIVASGGHLRTFILNGDTRRVIWLRRGLAGTLAAVAAWLAVATH